MSLPTGVRSSVDGVLAELGYGPIERAGPVGGGCINHGTDLATADGGRFFLKWSASADRSVFEAEAAGLRALAEATSLRVPEGATPGCSAEGAGWLLMEFVPRGRAGADYSTRLGEGLARLHASAPDAGSWGWEIDNWIGSLPQGNAASPTWGEFWRDRRIVPQLERARTNGLMTSSVMDDLVDRIPEALADVETVSLLHGDLWNGNAFPDEDGRPVLIDPAVYRGHGEVDLAMTELFGGFGRTMYEAYDAVRPIPSEYDAFRRDLYQLYYLLVHVNLFGSSYVAGSMAAAERVLRAL